MTERSGEFNERIWHTGSLDGSRPLSNSPHVDHNIDNPFGNYDHLVSISFNKGRHHEVREGDLDVRRKDDYPFGIREMCADIRHDEGVTDYRFEFRPEMDERLLKQLEKMADRFAQQNNSSSTLEAMYYVLPRFTLDPQNGLRMFYASDFLMGFSDKGYTYSNFFALQKNASGIEGERFVSTREEIPPFGFEAMTSTGYGRVPTEFGEETIEFSLKSGVSFDHRDFSSLDNAVKNYLLKDPQNQDGFFAIIRPYLTYEEFEGNTA